MMIRMYRGAGEQQKVPEKPFFSERDFSNLNDPSLYLADTNVAEAVNVAVLLSRPLLVSGEPGTGKTQLADSIAWELHLGAPLRFETKSTSVARDLFYTYDLLGRFHAAQLKEKTRADAFITINALGTAIIRANDPQVAADVLPGFLHGGKRRSLVLIDEIDKAPRDFPNDILTEIDQMFFRMPELGLTFDAPPEMRPIVIITTNSEKGLPDAFLRRCIYCHIEFPGRDRLMAIVESRIGTHLSRGTPFLADTLDVFYQLRKDSLNLRKKPFTAELIAWLLAMRGLSDSRANPVASDPELLLKTLPALIKTPEDYKTAEQEVRQWIAARG